MRTRDVKQQLKRKEPREVEPLSKRGLSTGSTLLNLACTDHAAYGFLKGHYYFFVGDSRSGKTWLCLTCLAEASINPNFDNYRFIYDNGEGGALMNIRKFFGDRVIERLEAPHVERDGTLVHSQTLEEFYYHLDDAVRDGRPFIYILDSMDVLDSDQASSKFEETKEAHRKGKTVSGSYGDGKAKINSQNIRRFIRPLESMGSILIIINQTRDNLGFGFEKKTRSGGRALTFYACMELWSEVAGKIKRNVKGKSRQLGTLCKVATKKNRINGKDRSVQIPIYWSYGIDDIGSCVDYLIEEDHWTVKGKKNIIATELEFEGSREKLIRHIENKNLEKDVREIVADVWREIDEACTIRRKNRYA